MFYNPHQLCDWIPSLDVCWWPQRWRVIAFLLAETERSMTSVMAAKTILMMTVLNIALPTLDTFTDISLVYKLYRGAYECKWNEYYRDEYNKCRKDPMSYCDEKNKNVCSFSTHQNMAVAMLIPFLLNYFFCLTTFYRKENNNKFTFIFALLNIYAQFGMNKRLNLYLL